MLINDMVKTIFLLLNSYYLSIMLWFKKEKETIKITLKAIYIWRLLHFCFYQWVNENNLIKFLLFIKDTLKTFYISEDKFLLILSKINWKHSISEDIHFYCWCFIDKVKVNKCTTTRMKAKLTKHIHTMHFLYLN